LNTRTARKRQSQLRSKYDPYLDNILRSVDRNIRLLSRSNADTIEMLVFVVNYCSKKIEDMQNENDNHMGT
jgi:hypothetical protein